MAINYARHYIDKSDIDSVIKVLKSNLLTQGPVSQKFERKLKSKFGSKYCCVVVNGTAALHLSGLALGWKKGDIVLTSSMTFLASANAIVYCGATPSFVDIDSTYTIDPNKLEDKIKRYQNKGKKVKAIIGVDYAGHPCDWTALKFLGKKYNIKLINDNCHALGASYKKTSKYAIKYADIVTHSYHPAKNITSGEGGAVLTNNKTVMEIIKNLRNHGMLKDPKYISKKNGPWYYEMRDIGYNYRISDIHCALGLSQLNKLDQFIINRRRIAKYYNNKFRSDARFIIPYEAKNINHAYHLYPLQINFNNQKINKKEFYNRMREKGINLMVHYIPVHLQPFYKDKYNFKLGDFPVAEKFYQNVFSIPNYPTLKNNEINKVINSIYNLLN